MPSIKEAFSNYLIWAREARPDKLKEKMQGTTRQVRGLTSEANFGPYRFIIDEPKEFGGASSAANPAEMLMAAVGASLEVTTRVWAEYWDIDLQSVGTEISGELDIRGFCDTDPSQRSGFERLAIKVLVKSAASEKDLQRLVRQVERSCPVYDTLRRNVQIDLRWERSMP